MTNIYKNRKLKNIEDLFGFSMGVLFLIVKFLLLKSKWISSCEESIDITNTQCCFDFSICFQRME